MLIKCNLILVKTEVNETVTPYLTEPTHCLFVPFVCHLCLNSQSIICLRNKLSAPQCKTYSNEALK